MISDTSILEGINKAIANCNSVIDQNSVLLEMFPGKTMRKISMDMPADERKRLKARIFQLMASLDYPVDGHGLFLTRWRVK